MATFAWILFALLVAAGLAAVVIYNSLVALNRRCDQAATDVDVQLKLRHDLIPNLLETVKGSAGHERGTLDAVIKARSVAIAAPAGAQAQAENMLTGALGRLMAVTEAYPDLKANAAFAELQAELGDIENKIAGARRFHNGAVTEYNTAREQFPANVIGDMFKFAGRDLVVVVATERHAEIEAAPVVRF